ncbi:MAG: hypothetical protein ACI8XM_001584 [Haloarculaceae archaeon]|jgi:hypothetical protein
MNAPARGTGAVPVLRDERADGTADEAVECEHERDQDGTPVRQVCATPPSTMTVAP